jgi:hypothetical protein
VAVSMAVRMRFFVHTVAPIPEMPDFREKQAVFK